MSSTVHAKVVRFDMRDLGARNLVQFTSDGPLDRIVGLSNFITGWMEVDSDHVVESLKGEFEVDLRTFKTGIEMRDEQLRDKWLLAPEFPTATYTITKLAASSRPKLENNVPLSWRVEGVLKGKGTSKPQVVLMKVTYHKESEMTRARLPGNLLKVAASFDLDTSAFGVPLPAPRYARNLQVLFDVVGTDAPPMQSAEAPKK